MATTTKKAAPAAQDAKAQDAIAMLTADHKMVKALFKEFEKLTEQDDADDQKAAIVEQICSALTVHAQVEEEIFYPAVREAIDDDDLIDEADIEHASAKDLIAQLESLEPGDDHYDARVTVLGEYIDHHVKEEEGEMFPKARKADLDTGALGEEMATRKAELMAELGIEDDEDEAPARATKAANGAKKSRTPARK